MEKYREEAVGNTKAEFEEEENEKGCECIKRRSKERSDADKRTITSRLNRIIGQLNGIGKMVAEDRYCDDILIQLSAVSNAVKSLANFVLEEHMHSCIVKDIQENNLQAIDEVLELIKRFQ